MLAQLKKLLELKSLITLMLAGLVIFVVVWQTVQNGFAFSPEFVGGIVMSVFTYFFNRNKKDTKDTSTT